MEPGMVSKLYSTHACNDPLPSPCGPASLFLTLFYLALFFYLLTSIYQTRYEPLPFHFTFGNVRMSYFILFPQGNQWLLGYIFLLGEGGKHNLGVWELWQ